MKGFFDPNGAVYQILNTIAQMVTVSVLCLICCIPIVTAGAAFAAMAKITQNLVRQEGSTGASAFFRAFRENFRQGTLAWLVNLVVLAVLVLDCYLVLHAPEGTVRTVLLVGLALLTVFCTAVPAVAYQLMARYSNTLPAHLKNAFALTVGRFPRALVITVICLTPVAVAALSPMAFFYCLPVWLFIMPGFTFYAASRLLNPVFRELEQEN